MSRQFDFLPNVHTKTHAEPFKNAADKIIAIRVCRFPKPIFSQHYTRQPRMIASFPSNSSPLFTSL
jgi:hypothetical protein